LEFRRSHDEVCLQLADFAAFSIARTQWLLSTSKRKPRDEAFLRAVAAEHLEIVNLAKMPVDLDSFTAADYADALMVDRLLKGLPDAPPRS
jgi:hypothetical protein